LRYDGCGYVHESDAAQIRSRNETRNISHDSSTYRDQQRVAVGTTPHKISRKEFDGPQVLGRLAVIHQVNRVGRFCANTTPHALAQCAPNLRRRHDMYAGKIPESGNLFRREADHPRATHHRVRPRR
jgi:hypothetical protein